MSSLLRARAAASSLAARRPPRLAAACILVAALSASCEDTSATPDRALKRFLRAAAKGDTAEVFAAVTPRQQVTLRDLARRATAYASGRRRFTPEDLLATSLTEPGTVSSIEVISVEGDRAKVRLRDTKRKLSEDWQLLRVNDIWRVVLPAKMLEAASAAASAGGSSASSPASTRSAASPAAAADGARSSGRLPGE